MATPGQVLGHISGSVGNKYSLEFGGGQLNSTAPNSGSSALKTNANSQNEVQIQNQFQNEQDNQHKKQFQDNQSSSNTISNESNKVTTNLNQPESLVKSTDTNNRNHNTNINNNNDNINNNNDTNINHNIASELPNDTDLTKVSRLDDLKPQSEPKGDPLKPAATFNNSANVDTKSNNLSYTQTLMDQFPEEDIIALLLEGNPASVREYSDHLYTLLSLLSDNKVPKNENTKLTTKLMDLMNNLANFLPKDLIHLDLHIVIEKNFDLLVRLSTEKTNLVLSTLAVRFLTSLLMLLNYWQTYNLVLWKPAVAHFMAIIQLDLNSSYQDFLRNYKRYQETKKIQTINKNGVKSANHGDRKRGHQNLDKQLLRASKRRANRARRARSNENSSYYFDESSNSEMDDDHDKYITQTMSDGSKYINDKKREKGGDEKSKSGENGSSMGSHKIIKRLGLSSSKHLGEIGSIDSFDRPSSPIRLSPNSLRAATSSQKLITSLQLLQPSIPQELLSPTQIHEPSPTTFRLLSKSSNYDPDVVHECQLPSADIPNALCLRRFLRKYELIRHQETVHSKKKKLFKCFVCVKQNPSIGPRIFTRHDTLAKHIRVNHKILGKEAKAEVAYLKKHAEVVEEGDITVHVGRRKTKVDFELRAHMDKRHESRDNESEDEYDDYDEI